MVPSPDQIRMAAYFRWLRRGAGHGLDVDDWGAAEQELLFALNYRVVAHHRLDDPARHIIGGDRPRVCRFCELSAPRTVFASPEPTPTVPADLGNTSLFSADLCDDCREQFAEGIDDDFRRFAGPLLGGAEGAAASLPIAAYKALVRMALAILPGRELDHFRDALEWVCNPDHDLDGGTFAGQGVQWHRAVRPAGEGPWVALARRVDGDAPFPYMLFFLGTPAATFEVPVPLCSRDEDLDGRAPRMPRVASPVAAADGVSAFLPVSPPRARRAALPRLT